jgi:hypothetical protein
MFNTMATSNGVLLLKRVCMLGPIEIDFAVLVGSFHIIVIMFLF